MARLLPYGLTALLAALALAAPVAAKGGGGKPQPKKKGGLPAGCERLTEGRDAALSLDGKRLAYTKWTTDPSKVDYHGIEIPQPRAYVRDLAAKKDTKVPNADAVPVGWTTAGGLCLASGVVVDPATGKAVPGTAKLPSNVPVSATDIAWSRDGKRLAVVPDWTATPLPQPGVPQYLTLVEADGTLRELNFGNKIYGTQPSALSWSPDSMRLAYNVAYFGDGSLPIRRVAVVDVASGKQEVVSDLALDNKIPGMQDVNLPMRALPGTDGPVIGDAVWDKAGKWFTYVHGTGDGNADVYVVDAEGKEKLRQTSDGETKWSPALDPAARRVAFFAGKATDWSNNPNRGHRVSQNAERWPAALESCTLRVLDLLTQAATDLPVAVSSGLPGNLAWSPDGTRLLYEIHGGDAEGTYSQTVAPAGPAPEGKRLGTKAVDPIDELVDALRSGLPQRIEWACDQMQTRWDGPKLVPVLRETLLALLPKPDYRPTVDILRLLAHHEVKEAWPEVQKALAVKDELVARTAVETVLDWKHKEALPDLDKARASHPSMEVRVKAAGTMVALGDARGWPDLERAVKDKEKEVRAEVCYALGRVLETRSVVLLLPLVADDAVLYTTHGGEQTVGDAAVLALVRVTGRFFRRDVAKWQAWWKDEAKGERPAGGDVSGAMAEYEAWMNEREEAHQKKMKEMLEGFGKGK